MQTEIMYRPAYAMAVVKLAPNEEIRVEAGSMVSMTDGLNIETKMEGGFLKALARSVLTSESFFVNTYKAPAQGGEIGLAPTLPGDLFTIEMAGQDMMVQSGSFVACASSVAIDTSWGGAKTFFASEGLLMLKASGTGTLIVSSYGAIHEKDLDAGEKFTIDSGHLVSFTSGIGFKVRSIGGLKSSMFSGEGLVVDLTGPGKVLLQTRSQDAFISWLLPQIPTKSS